jgi:hypothetical protein
METSSAMPKYAILTASGVAGSTPIQMSVVAARYPPTVNTSPCAKLMSCSTP